LATLVLAAEWGENMAHAAPGGASCRVLLDGKAWSEMKTSASLTLVAIGGILAFAVRTKLPWFSFPLAGWVLVLTGVAGLLLPRKGRGRVRRRLVTRRGAGGEPVVTEEETYTQSSLLGEFIPQPSKAEYDAAQGVVVQDETEEIRES
jgi:hypothetical protein